MRRSLMNADNAGESYDCDLFLSENHFPEDTLDSPRGNEPSTFQNLNVDHNVGSESAESVDSATSTTNPLPAVQQMILSDTFGRYSHPSTVSNQPEAIASASAPTPGLASALVERRRPKGGILRLDMSKPRRSSGGSVEFRAQPQMLGKEPGTPIGLTSPHQLSVTWAESCDINDSHLKLQPKYEGVDGGELRSIPHERINSPDEPLPNTLGHSLDFENYEIPQQQNCLTDEYYSGNNYNNSNSNNIINNNSNGNNTENNNGHNDEDDEEDYSVSVSAIMQRRASIRGYRNKRGSRCSRRASSPMDHVFDSMEARRRSSVYTSSSDEGTNQESTQEQIFENIRLHKEVIQSVKLQPWPIRKKLKLVRQAKTYVARHEGALQERFAMSRSTKDLFARFKILMAARWRHWKRETSSFLTVLIPWELRIKEIESHFGSGVASYFTFLRWLMWVNIMIAIPLVAFVIGPEYFATKHDETDPRKKMSDHEYKVAGNLFTIWEFEGFLKYSPMFYGYYSSTSGASSLGYKLPMAYFLTAVLVYIYSFVATLRKMAENSRNSKLSSKDDECTFSWKLFTGWDFMIGHAETAHNRIASVVVGFKEALLEEAEKKKDKRNWRIIMQRILVNLLVMALLAASGYTVVLLVNKSEELARQDNWLSRNAVNVTMTLLSFFLPMIFEALGLFENWHPRQQLRLQLARIMILNMLNLYSLMFSFIYKINSKEKPLQRLKINNETATAEMHQLTALISNLSAALNYEALGLSSMTTTTSTTTPTSIPMLLTDESGGNMSSTTTLSGEDIWNGNSSTTADTIFSTTAAAMVFSTLRRLKCYNITVKCSKPSRVSRTTTLATTTLLLMNLTTTMFPITNEPVPTTLMTTTPEESVMAASSTLPTAETSTTNELWTTATPPSATLIDRLLTTLGTGDYGSTITTKRNANADENFTETTPQQLSTTTVASKAGNFFDYYDYFAGMPIDFKEEENDEEENENKANKVKKVQKVRGSNQEPTKRTKGQRKPAEKKTENLKKVKKRKIKGKINDTETSAKRSKHKRRDGVEPNATAQLNGALDSKNHNKVALPVMPANERNVKNAALTRDRRETDDLKDINSNAGNSAIYNDVDSDNGIDTSTANNGSVGDAVLWVHNAVLPEILAYFTTSTTTSNDGGKPTIPTKLPSTTTATPKTNTMPTEPETTETTLNYDGLPSTTPDFIDDKEIEDVGESSVYEPNEIDDGYLGNCIRTICDEIIPTDMYTSSTTDMDSSPDLVTTSSQTPLERHQKRLSEVKVLLKEVQKNLTNMCWETSLGQELSKVIVFDGLMGIVAPLCIDFLRALFVRYVNQNWCWDMEKTFPQYGDFKIAENILTLIYNQGQVWMGIFFSPGLVLINLLKLIIMMYFRSWIVLTCNVPHEVVFKASKSNNFYLTLLLTMLFLCVLPVGYAIVWLRPSWHCGPFSDYNRIAEFITNTTRNALPKELHEPLDYLTSASTVIPLLLLLILIIYYLISLTGALREANQDLRTQLQKEREEERRKMFKVPESKQAEPSAAALKTRWRKVLEASSPVTPTSQPPDFETEEYKNQARKELISRIMKKALRKGSATSDEDSVVRQGRDDDDTDTEHHDSLPHDEEGKERVFGLSKLQQIRRTRKPSLVDIVQIAKSERERERERRTPSTAVTANIGSNATKDAHPKSRFKVEKYERKEKDIRDKERREEKSRPQTPMPTPTPKPKAESTEHDPEINSRIVNERRQSLLRRKREDDERKRNEFSKVKIEDKTESTSEQKFQKPVSPSQMSEPEVKRSKAEGSFEVVNEKKIEREETSTEAPAEKYKQLQDLGSKFKLIKQRIRSPASNTSEPEVFKFDEKPEKTEQRARKLGKPVEIPSIPSIGELHLATQMPKTSGEDTSPPHTPSVLKHTNSEKLANFSRQGRKKIGSFLQLMREAAKKFENEQLQLEQNERAISEPTTPTPKPTCSTSNSETMLPVCLTSDSLENRSNVSSNSSTSPMTTTVDPGITASPAKVIPKTPAKSSATTQDQKIRPKLVSLEALEELDHAGPITFPQRSVSQRRRTPTERPSTMRQDSQTSIWSDNIPTITISTTGSDECVADTNDASPSAAPSSPATSAKQKNESPTTPETSRAANSTNSTNSSPEPKVNIIKITLENGK